MNTPPAPLPDASCIPIIKVPSGTISAMCVGGVMMLSTNWRKSSMAAWVALVKEILFGDCHLVNACCI